MGMFNGVHVQQIYVCEPWCTALSKILEQQMLQETNIQANVARRMAKNIHVEQTQTRSQPT